jgi:hypothetical protein
VKIKSDSLKINLNNKLAEIKDLKLKLNNEIKNTAVSKNEVKVINLIDECKKYIYI